MNLKECIITRRSIRKYKKDDISDELIHDLLDCARFAPSPCNAQPWRFKIIKDCETKQLLSQASFNQKHIAEAPVVIVCCGNINDYIIGSLSGNEELYNLDMIDNNFYKMLKYRTDGLKNVQVEKLVSEVSFNVAIAVEHIVLRAVELSLGSCWVKAVDERKIREIFNWNDNIKFVNLLTLGYPDEEPKSIKKLSIQDIIL
ncbi:MAG: nitroreductase family protein [Anaeromicrobium sp.]|uniref:nitroreductase family protein n=1 Tax=Anaeromicrobium sp. TaxID=1929132 RepID=UPI0025DCDE15|nr:nitroreductase family protein [Anaeromicrobium sp.]MCT4593052.1 nitroreductase family protein [Anaeromicrobium sp.]